MSYHSHFQDQGLELKSKSKDSKESWITSFADVVTVLLCFFIIFYMVEKKIKKNGFGTKDGTIQEFVGKASHPQVMTLVETVKELKDVKIFETNQFLEIHFPPMAFFQSGSTHISKNGKQQIDYVANALKDVGENFYIQVQGYTDDDPVRDLSHRWWKNNMELSVERSLNVYQYLLTKGIKKDNLTVSGYGANRPLGDESDKNQRRITIKIEPKSYDKI